MPVPTEAVSRPDPSDRPVPQRFYITGGTLPTDASSYVTRQADTDLIERLRAGDFCYVLNSRQMGKSSLMVRTANQLRAEGVAVAVIDLTSIGQNLTAEQWYEGILLAIGLELNIEDQIEDFIDANSVSGPLLRFMNAVRHVVLPLMQSKPVVLFVDEIDAVRSLPFSTDEFFAAIRECYNRRTTDPDMNRLTFCLLGVATPADLIRDVRTTPFNIGRRVELTDFTAREAAPLAQGMTSPTRNGRLLLKRVLYWTNGHPRLTQGLCLAIAGERSIQSPFQVDRLVGALFLSKRARETDDNLAFVRNRMLKSEVDLFDLLELYTRIWRTKKLPFTSDETIRADDSNPLVAVLLLAGVVRLSGKLDGSLRVSNRIYRQVFDPTWAEMSLPDGALRRERIAVGRARLQVASIAACIVALIAWLAAIAIQGTDEAKLMRQNAEKLLYNADMNLAQQAWTTDNVPRVLELLKQVRTTSKPGFEWTYLNRLCAVEKWRVRAPNVPITGLTFQPDGKRLFLGLKDGAVSMCGEGLIADVPRLRGPSATVLRCSPDGRLIFVDGRIYAVDTGVRKHAAPDWFNPEYMACSADMGRFASWTQRYKIVVWDSASGKEGAPIRASSGGVNCLALSPNGRLLAVGTGDGWAETWDTTTAKRLQSVHAAGGDISYVGFQRDSGNVVTISSENLNKSSRAELWDVKGNRMSAFDVSGRIFAISPDGSQFAWANNRGTLRVCRFSDTAHPIVIKGNTAPVTALAFSPDGRSIATASADHLIKVWDSTDNGETETLDAAEMGVSATDITITPSPVLQSARSDDGRRIILCGNKPIIFNNCIPSAVTDGPSNINCAPITTGLTATIDGVSVPRLNSDSHDDSAIGAVDFSPNGTEIVTGTNDGAVAVWDAASGNSKLALLGHSAKILSATYSPDGNRIVTSSADRTVRLWESHTGAQIYSFDVQPSDRIALFSLDGTALILAKTDLSDPTGTIVYSSKSADRKALAQLARQAIDGYKKRHIPLTISRQTAFARSRFRRNEYQAKGLAQ